MHLVTLPPQEFAALRFSGSISDESREAHNKRLLAAVTGAGKHAEGEPSLLTYDPPFALPFLRRNEVAVRLDEAPGQAPAGGSPGQSAGSG